MSFLLDANIGSPSLLSAFGWIAAAEPYAALVPVASVRLRHLANTMTFAHDR
jgi:hypothetical protein